MLSPKRPGICAYDDLRMTISIKTESCVEGLSHMTHVLQSDLRKMSSIKAEHMRMR